MKFSEIGLGKAFRLVPNGIGTYVKTEEIVFQESGTIINCLDLDDGQLLSTHPDDEVELVDIVVFDKEKSLPNNLIQMGIDETIYSNIPLYSLFKWGDNCFIKCPDSNDSTKTICRKADNPGAYITLSDNVKVTRIDFL